MDMKLYVRAQRDRVAAIACVALGALALLMGWIGVSGNALVYKQLPYVVSGGLVGIALVGIGTTLWLSADLSDEWRKLDRIDEALRAGAGGPPPERSADKAPASHAESTTVQLEPQPHDEIAHDDDRVHQRPRRALRASRARTGA